MMSSRPKQHGAQPAKVSSSDSNQHLRPVQQKPLQEVLLELSDALKTLHTGDIQQEIPLGTLGEAVAKRYKKIGVNLPALLWAFAVIFSPSRKGGHVVASVLREEPGEKGHFTLYLTNNLGSWPKSAYSDEYRKIWENAVNGNTSEIAYNFESALWKRLTDFCFKRINDYLREAKWHVRKLSKGKRGRVQLNSLKIPTELKEFLKSLGHNKKGRHARTHIENCWKAFATGDNIKKFDERHRVVRDPKKWKVYGKEIGVFKHLENLAKVPLAFHIFNSFRRALVSQRAHLEITFIDKTSYTRFETQSSELNRPKAEQEIDQMAPENTQLTNPAARSTLPHCEIQMLQLLPPSPETKDIWNVIGCSKRPCYVCAHILRESDLRFEASHGKIYHQNLFAAEGWLADNETMESVVRRLRDELAKTVESALKSTQVDASESDDETSMVHPRRIKQPDSPVLLDWASIKVEDLKSSPLNVTKPAKQQFPHKKSKKR